MADANTTYYAMSASRGFSYLVPKTVQAALTTLLKKLPPAARPIYREFYRDVMAAKDCAQESSTAMAEFIEESFPTFIADHNRWARLMNEEIDWHEHSYEPVKFPILVGGAEDDLDGENEEDIDVYPSRKRAAAESASERSTGQTAKRHKTLKASQTTELEPLAIPGPELSANHSSLPPQPTEAGYESTRLSSRSSLVSVQPKIFHGEQSLGHEIEVIEPTYRLPSPNEEVSVDKSEAKTSKKQEDNPSDKDNSHNSVHTDQPHPWDDWRSPSEEWADGLAAIEAFDWDKPGSRWEPGRGLVSIHYEDISPPKAGPRAPKS